MVLIQDKLKNRARVLLKLMKVAYELRDMDDFHSLVRFCLCGDSFSGLLIHIGHTLRWGCWLALKRSRFIDSKPRLTSFRTWTNRPIADTSV